MWYWTGDGFSRARMARHSIGCDVVLCAPGPSMEKVERQPGILVAALTKAYPLIKPDIFFGMDTPECYDRRVWAESFMKVSRAGYQGVQLDGKPLAMYPNTYFAPMREGPVSNIFRFRGHETDFLWRRDTLMSALHVLIWMGAGANGHVLYFNGFNLGHSKDHDYTPGVEKKLTPALRRNNQHLFDKQIALLAEFQRLAKLNGITCMNTSFDSPLGKFMPSRSLNVALDLARRDIPKSEPLMHSFETDVGKKYLEKIRQSKVLPFNRNGIRAALQNQDKPRIPAQFIREFSLGPCPTLGIAS